MMLEVTWTGTRETSVSVGADCSGTARVRLFRAFVNICKENYLAIESIGLYGLKINKAFGKK